MEHISIVAAQGTFICKQANAGEVDNYPYKSSAEICLNMVKGKSRLCARFIIYSFILWRHLPSSCCLNLVPPSTIDFSGLQISFSGFLPEPFKISKNGFLHITLHTSAQNILKLQVPRSKALGGVWTESSKMSPLLYNNRFD